MFAMKAIINGIKTTRSGKAMTIAATIPMTTVINQMIRIGPKFFVSTSQPRLNPSRRDLSSSTMARSACVEIKPRMIARIKMTHNNIHRTGNKIKKTDRLGLWPAQRDGGYGKADGNRDKRNNKGCADQERQPEHTPEVRSTFLPQTAKGQFLRPRVRLRRSFDQANAAHRAEKNFHKNDHANDGDHDRNKFPDKCWVIK